MVISKMVYIIWWGRLIDDSLLCAGNKDNAHILVEILLTTPSPQNFHFTFEEWKEWHNS